MPLQAVRDWARELREQCSRSSASAPRQAPHPAPPPPHATPPLPSPLRPPLTSILYSNSPTHTPQRRRACAFPQQDGPALRAAARDPSTGAASCPSCRLQHVPSKIDVSTAFQFSLLPLPQVRNFCAVQRRHRSGALASHPQQPRCAPNMYSRCSTTWLFPWRAQQRSVACKPRCFHPHI